jgi:hypothetical protein
MCVLNVTLPHVRFNGLLAMLNDDAVGSACAPMLHTANMAVLIHTCIFSVE